MADPSAPQLPHTPHQASGSAVRVPDSVQERSAVNVELTKAVFAAWAAEDYDLQRLCEMKQHQYLLSCHIHDLERTAGRDPQLEGLPDLRISLAGVNAELQQQQQQQPASSAGQPAD